MNTRIPYCLFLFCIAGLAFASALPSPARAQCELTAEADPLFGTSASAIDVDGDTMAIGISGQQTKVQVFRRLAGGWQQEAELATPGMAFGFSPLRLVVLQGDRLAVAAETAQSVYIFARQGTTWSLEKTLSYPAASGRFGCSVDLDGDFLAIGTSDWSAGGAAAYIFELVAGQWIEHERFICSGLGIGQLPRVVALEGDVLAMSEDAFCEVVPAGASAFRTPTEKGGNRLRSCHGQDWDVFRRGPGGWVDETPPFPFNFCPASGIDIDGGRIVTTGIEIFGAQNGVMVWEYAAGEWVQTEAFGLGDNPSASFTIPFLDYDGDRLLVGCSAYSQPFHWAGNARMYDRIAGSLIESVRFQHVAPADGDGFGFQAALGENEVVVLSGRGSGYRFDISDCNGSGFPDLCANDCDDDLLCEDCNGNGIADGCDLDCDSNLVPDDCECTAAAAPLPEPEGLAKNRYISFVPPTTCAKSAIRVTMRSLHHPEPANLPCCPGPDLASFEAGPNCVEGPNGCVRWVGPPGTYVDSVNAGSTFTAAMLQCEPYYHDWSGIDLLHVTGREIVPSSIYDVEAIDEGCDAGAIENFSAPMEVTTARWADVAGEFQDPGSTPNQPNVVDIGTMVDRLKDLPTAPMRPRMQLQISAALPGLGISVIEVGHVVDAVKGFAFPYAGPIACGP